VPRNARERAEDVALLPRVVANLAELDLDPRDQAAARLAELYARRIDKAGVIAAAADRALRDAVLSGDPALAEQVGALKAKLAEQVALKDLGARLEAVLAALGATPAARVKVPAALPSGPSKLQAFRGGAS
jgi:hypothetical protein